jgi:predicted ATPase
MINHLHVENFKSWEKLDISLGKVTGLFGTNSSGKSSLLQFILLLKQTKNATDRGLVLDFGGPDQFVNLGSYQDVIYKNESRGILSWRLDWKLKNKLNIGNPFGKRTEILFTGEVLSVESQAHLRDKTLQADSLKYIFSNTSFYIEPKKTGSTEHHLLSHGNKDFKFVRNKARAWALPGPIKTHLFPDQAKTYYQNTDFLSLFETEYESLIDSIYYLGPLREHPKREYPWSGASPLDVGKKGERTIEAILAATARNEKRNLGPKTKYKSFQEMIAYWLKELGLINEFRIEEIGVGANLYRAKVKRDRFSPEALLTDVGFGVSQVLPALVLLYYVPEGSTILMEQPEIHLHPSVQSALADAVIIAAKTRNLQVIIESHSEHLLRRFQRRVAEEEISSDEIKLYFCNSVEGKSRLDDLGLDIFGDIKNWPTNFFGNEMEEIAATRRASLTRKLKENDGSN